MISAALYCPRLVGRDEELAGLLRLATEAASGQARIALLSGEAGIGKTRLLNELKAWAARRATVLVATCTAFAPVPLGPIQTLLAALDPASVANEPERDEAEEGAAQRLRLFRNAVDALRAAAQTRPVVVIIDDVHWADTATLELLQYLATELSSERIFVVLAFRTDGDIVPALDRTVSRLSRREHVHHMTLEPLSGSAIVELVEAALGDREPPGRDIMRDLRERCEGNPLFAEELLKSAVDGGGDFSAAASLRALISERLARVSPANLHVLEIAAMIGRRFDIAFLERVAGTTSRAETLAFLRLAVAEHFLIEDRAIAGTFSFRHALVRDAILAPLLLIESRAMHQTIAACLAQEPDANERAAELSEHYWHAGDVRACAPFAELAAARAISRHAYREAAEQYERALACGAPDERTSAILHDGAAVAHAALGNATQTDAHYTAAAIAFEAVGDFERAIDARLGIGMTRQRSGDHTGAKTAIAEAAALERRAPEDRLRLRIAAQAAQLSMLVGDWAAAEIAIAQAEPLLAHGRPRDLFRFYSSRGGIRYLDKRDYEGGIADTERAVEFARESGSPMMMSAAITNYGLHASRAGQIHKALAAFEEALAIVERYGELYAAARTRAHYATGLLHAGRLEEARKQLYDLLAERHTQLNAASMIAATAVRVSIVLRDESLATRAEPMKTLERALVSAEWRSWCDLANAVVLKYAVEGNIAAATELQERLVAGAPAEENTCEFLISVGACGERRLAERTSESFARWRSSGSAFVRACVALYEGYTSTRFGRPKDGQARANDAAAAFAKLEMPLLEAESLALAGAKQRAAAIMESLGARQLERRILTSEAKAETRNRTLTRREREVATLAVGGFSNRDIASKLSLSERTVESHLASIYAKTGVASRTELVAALREELLST